MTVTDDDAVVAARERLAARGVLYVSPSSPGSLTAESLSSQNDPTLAVDRHIATATVQRRRGARTLIAARPAPTAAAKRPRRLILVSAAGVTAAVVLALAVAGLAYAAGRPPARNTQAVCRQFDALRSDVVNGSVDAAGLRAELFDLEAIAASAVPAVEQSISRLRLAGRPGTADFLVAQAAVADACATS